MTFFIRNPVAVITLWLLVISGVTAEEWNVGFQIIPISDSAFKNEIAVWYPTQVLPKNETLGTVALLIAKDSEPQTPMKGLIIISHGFSGNFLGHNDTAQTLAKFGYVVATPTHPDLAGLRTGKPELDPLISRPQHIQSIIDEVSTHPLFESNKLENRVGIIGFSIGAYTALVTAGASPNFSNLASYCATNKKDELLCSIASMRRFESIEPHLAAQQDSKIKAAVLLAPAYGPLFSEKSFTKVTIPIKMYSAEKDRALDNHYNAHHIKGLLTSNVTHDIVKDAGHFIFMAACSNELKLAVPSICNDSELVDRIGIHQKINNDIIDFFNTMLIE